MARTRSDDARTSMLTATRQIALADGLDAVTIDEVHRRSGVAKTTIYRHFDGRNQLLIAALDGAVTAPEAPDTGSLVGDLQAFLTNLVPLFADPAIRTLSLEIFAAAARDPQLEALRSAFYNGRMGPVVSLIQRAQQRGELGIIDDLTEIVIAVQGPLVVRSLSAPASIDHLDTSKLAERAATQLRQLAPPD